MKARPIIVELLRRPKAAIPDENGFSRVQSTPNARDLKRARILPSSHVHIRPFLTAIVSLVKLADRSLCELAELQVGCYVRT